MTEDRKSVTFKRKRGRSGFWRFYSLVLTLVCILSILCVSASAATAKRYMIKNGLLYYQRWSDDNTWTLVDFGAPSNPRELSVSRYQEAMRAFAEESGIALASSGGGLTLAELQSALNDYVGQRVHEYNFWVGGQGGGLEGITVNDLYDAISKNQIYSTMPLYDTYGGSYLDKDGKVSAGSDNMRNSITDVLGAGLLGLNTNINKGLLTLDDDLVTTNNYLDAFRSANHDDLTSGFSTNHTDLTTVSKNLVGSGSLRLSLSGLNLAGGSSNYTSTVSDLLTALGDVGVRVTGNQTTGFRLVHSDFSLLSQRLIASEAAMVPLDFAGEHAFNSAPDGKYVFDLWLSDAGESLSWSGSGALASVAALNNVMQNDLAKLRYVLADDKDIEISQKQEPVKDSVADNFAGEGAAAVKPADVDDMAGISDQLQGSLNTGANAMDSIGFINGSSGWGYFSKKVADELEGNVVNAVSDDSDDFIHFYDPAVLDHYLSGGDAPW